MQMQQTSSCSKEMLGEPAGAINVRCRNYSNPAADNAHSMAKETRAWLLEGQEDDLKGARCSLAGSCAVKGRQSVTASLGHETKRD